MHISEEDVEDCYKIGGKVFSHPTTERLYFHLGEADTEEFCLRIFDLTLSQEHNDVGIDVVPSYVLYFYDLPDALDSLNRMMATEHRVLH